MTIEELKAIKDRYVDAKIMVDGEFVANLAADISALVTEVERLQEQIVRMRTCENCNPDGYCPECRNLSKWEAADK